jgi:CubicO group peptidase (beta-lactamase class C family)
MRRRFTAVVSRRVDVLRQIDEWGAEHAAAGVVSGAGVVATRGDVEHVFAWASVTKVLTALAVLVAAEDEPLDLDEPAGPPGSTVRHLLAHASGLPPDDTTPIAPPGRRRIYSNAGFEALEDWFRGRTGERPDGYLRGYLDLGGSLRGSAAHGYEGPLADALVLAGELVRPRLLGEALVREAMQVAFPGLDGVLPGFGRQTPNDWGLGFELRDAKEPHWTGTRNSPRTIGHFGRSGTFLWVDPEAGLALACLTDRPFGEWAVDAWPRLSDAVLGAAV